MIIELPHKFVPRHYQSPVLKAYLVDDIRHIILNWHRRCGKTLLLTNLVSAAAFKRVGAIYHTFPKLNQARRNIWEGITSEGIKFIDYFPISIVEKINNTEMKIEFKNGSIYRLLGTDNHNYDNIRGSNPILSIYDEFAEQNPMARDAILPILAENNGSEIIVSTPRGKNHFYKLFEAVKNSPDWFSNTLTIDDTLRDDGTPVVSREVVDQLITNSGWSQDKVDQEFYCSFEASTSGAYFSKQILACRKENRILNFPIDNSRPIVTVWDLGYKDATAIWFIQEFPDGTKIVNYYENHLEDLQHYINYVNIFREKNNIVYDGHYAPHDGKNRTLATGGKSIVDIANDLGLNFHVLPRFSSKAAAIEIAQSFFRKVTFHQDNCTRGIECLSEYHARYNEAMNIYSSEPEHNWASHGADAFIYIPAALERRNQGRNNRIIKNAVGLGELW